MRIFAWLIEKHWRRIDADIVGEISEANDFLEHLEWHMWTHRGTLKRVWDWLAGNGPPPEQQPMIYRIRQPDRFFSSPKDGRVSAQSVGTTLSPAPGGITYYDAVDGKRPDRDSSIPEGGA